ncbi:MAG TPA: DcrB-related protein [Candidatus Nanopelagicales bacterium]|nr:DcrB-related protein [Candidatus Nanopelagicales bacterium]
MPTYHTDEISFEIPDGFVDRSMTVLAPEGEPAISLVITRDPRTEEPLPEQVSKIVQAITKQIPNTKLLGQREREVGGLRGRELRATTAGKVPTYARQVFVDYYGSLLTLTITVKRAHQAFCDRTAESILTSLKFRKR